MVCILTSIESTILFTMYDPSMMHAKQLRWCMNSLWLTDANLRNELCLHSAFPCSSPNLAKDQGLLVEYLSDHQCVCVHLLVKA